MPKPLVAFYLSDTFMGTLCFGPVFISIVLIAVYYAGLWRLTHKADSHQPNIERYKRLFGRLIMAVTISPLLLLGANLVINNFVVFPALAEQAHADADGLVQAIEQFSARTGVYPDALSELVPTELAQVPTLPDGREFSYTSSGAGFTLTYGYVSLGAPTICRISSDSPGWYCD